MMEKKFADLNYNSVIDSLNRRYLKGSFETLNAIISSESSISFFQERCKELEANYKRMLDYTIQGAVDPERDKIYHHLLYSLYELNDEIYLTLRKKNTSGFPYNHWITTRSIDAIMSDLQKDNEEYLDELFTHYVALDQYTDDEINHLNIFFKSKKIASPIQSLMVSGLFINLLKRFDAKGLEILCKLCESRRGEIQQRATVALLFLLKIYDTRIPFYPTLQAILDDLVEVPSFLISSRNIILQIVKTQETEKIAKILRDEIIPEILKKNSHLVTKLNIDDLLKEYSDEDANPDWEINLELNAKFEEITELQLSGADVFMSSFAQLKTYPFFNTPCNWFIPFYKEKKEILLIMSSPVAKLMGDLCSTSFLCNSDKYSLYFSFQQISETQQNLLSERMAGELEEWSALNNDEKLIQKNFEAKDISKQYIHDLYRFFKLHPQRHHFLHDVFDLSFDFTSNNIINNLLNTEALSNIASYYFDQQCYTESCQLYLKLLKEDPTNTFFIQKIAYCYQQDKQYSLALSYYQQFDIYHPLSFWNIRKIALCYRNMEKTEEALDWYRKAEQIKPNDLKNQVSIGYCLLELKLYTDALAVFFKLEYLQPDNIKIWRSIVWCCFVTGKLEVAKKYSNKILAHTENQKHDHINRGHIEWCLNNKAEAFIHYKKSLNTFQFENDIFWSTMQTDIEWLKTLGVNEDEIPMMFDQLLYSLPPFL